MKHESNGPASTPTAVEAAVRLAAPKKDRTGAARSRRYRARKRAANRTLVPVERDATAITVTAAPAVNRDASVTPSVTVLPGRSVAPHIVAVAVALLAIILVIVGFYVNSTFLFAFGGSTEAGLLLAALGLTIDGLTLVLPSAATQLWKQGRHAWAITTGCVTVMAFAMTLLTTTGFVSTQIGDAVTGRNAIASQRAAIVEDLARLKAERAGLQFTPTAERAVTAAEKARDQECGRVGPNCRERVAELNAAHRNKALTERAVELDAGITALTAKLANLPAIATADPQIEGATTLVTWLSAGKLALTGHDIAMVRTFGLTVTPALAGLLFALALVLWQSDAHPR